jgi:hypothetical protein
LRIEIHAERRVLDNSPFSILHYQFLVTEDDFAKAAGVAKVMAE